MTSFSNILFREEAGWLLNRLVSEAARWLLNQLVVEGIKSLYAVEHTKVLYV